MTASKVMKPDDAELLAAECFKAVAAAEATRDNDLARQLEDSAEAAMQAATRLQPRTAVGALFQLHAMAHLADRAANAVSEDDAVECIQAIRRCAFALQDFISAGDTAAVAAACGDYYMPARS